MAVLIDVAAFSTPGAGGATSDTFSAISHGLSLNVGSGPNGTTDRGLVVAVLGVGAGAGTSSGMTCSWNGVAMTLIGTSSDRTGDVWLFGLLNPDTGTHNIALSWTGANQMEVGAASFVGVTQGSFAAAFKNFAKANGATTTNSLAVTNDAGDVAFAGHVTNGNYSSGSGTDIGHSNAGNLNSGGANYDTGTNPTLTYTSGGNSWSSVGCSVSAGAGASGITADLSKTQAGDSCSATAAVQVAASLAKTQAGDSVSGAGAVAISASGTPTGTGGSSSGAGAVALVAAMSKTQAANSLSATVTTAAPAAGSAVAASVRLAPTVAATVTLALTVAATVSLEPHG